MFHKIPIKKARLGLLVLISLLAAAFLPATVIGRPKFVPPPLSAGTVVCTGGPSFTLDAATGHIQTPDGNSIFMWTYANNVTGGTFQSPSPVLCVDEGDSVSITLNNPAGTGVPENVSIIFPGQTGVTTTGGTPGLFTAEAAPGGSVTYSFTAAQPGTYLYESGTNPHKQVQMGLYGGLIVRPALGAQYAYNNTDTEFDTTREYLLLIHDLDPELHKAVERSQEYDVTTKHDRYWFINGRGFPDSIAPTGASWLPEQPYGALVQVEASPNASTLPALIRYANAGMENHPFHPHGNHMRVIGRDGRRLDTAFENFNTTIGSGQTYDLLFRWINVEGWGVGGTPPRIKEQVTFSNLLNLVFKDGVSWFSGDPDLAVQADFPSDSTVFNQCGEFYFPWHSHALNEFQNFDEGFGGLATLVRVDQPGGCPP